MCFIDVASEVRYVIFTDSLSSLLAPNDFNTTHSVIQDILALFTSLDRARKSVIFCWIPSHVGITGNEKADEAAKRASRARHTRFLPLPATDFCAACLSHLRDKWQEDWDSTGKEFPGLQQKVAVGVRLSG